MTSPHAKPVVPKFHQPRFDLQAMLDATGRAMTDLANRLAVEGDRPLNNHERELAKTAITGTQLTILDEMSMFVLGGSWEDTEMSYASLRELMQMKEDL